MIFVSSWEKKGEVSATWVFYWESYSIQEIELNPLNGSAMLIYNMSYPITGITHETCKGYISHNHATKFWCAKSLTNTIVITKQMGLHTMLCYIWH